MCIMYTYDKSTKYMQLRNADNGKVIFFYTLNAILTQYTYTYVYYNISIYLFIFSADFRVRR